MNDFWKSSTYGVIKAMKATGNSPGIVAQWIEGARLWAMANDGRDAAAVKAWLPHWQARPFYTASELAPMWPALTVALGASKYLPPKPSVSRLIFALDYGGLPRLKNQNGTVEFRSPVTGAGMSYYIVEQIHYWSKLELSQEDFENALHS